MIHNIIVFTTILLMEILLSIDNASVLAIIVNKKLKDPNERKKAMKYGIVGAYVFRGLGLLLAAYLLYNPSVGAVLKILGGLYLIRLFYTHFTQESDSIEEGNTNWIDKITSKLGIGVLWQTIIAVEVLDLSLGVDNILACVSLSSNLYIVCGAVFLGILGMRFVAQGFSKLLQIFPDLENSAFIVILLLGIKMAIGGIFDFYPKFTLFGINPHDLLNHHNTDLIFSGITLFVFILPILLKKIK